MRNQLHRLSATTVVLLVLGFGVPPARADNGIPDQIAALQVQVNTLETSNSQLSSQVSDLQAQVNSLQASLMTLQHNSVLALNGVLTYDGNAKATAFKGANVFIVNGQDNTESANGLGNLVVGYNQPPKTGAYAVSFCTDGQYRDQASCIAAGGVWGNTQKVLGSHNVIIGDGHSYTKFGGLAVGYSHIINGSYASVSGGQINLSSGVGSSVSGGSENFAGGDFSSVSGGQFNTAEGAHSSVSGGDANVAQGETSSVSGGANKNASATSGWAGVLFTHRSFNRPQKA